MLSTCLSHRRNGEEKEAYGMGYEIHTAFERCEEWRAARMSEVEFVEAARA